MHLSLRKSSRRCKVASGGGDPQHSGTLFICSPRSRDTVYSPNPFIVHRFLCTIPFVLAASTTTAAPKIQAITHLVCKTLRPEYSDRAGADPNIGLFSSDNEETKLCNADPVVQAASAEFLTRKCSPRHLLKRPNDSKSDHHCNRYSELLNNRILGIRKLTLPARFPQYLTWALCSSFQLSDRKGRISTLRICMFGNLITDIAYLLVYALLRDRKGAYWFLLIAPVFEGLLGGTIRLLGSSCA